jgi:ribosomal protein L24
MLLITALLLLANDKVEITKGFYKGCQGRVVYAHTENTLGEYMYHDVALETCKGWVISITATSLSQDSLRKIK